MSQYSEEYWDISGTPLHTLAWGVEVSSEGIPPRRGENFTVPYRHGEVWRPKLYGPRPVALAMWVTSTDQNGNEAATDQAARAQLRDNLETLKALFAPVATQLAITRRIRLGSGLVSRFAYGECVGTLDFVPDTVPDAIRFGVELQLADPYWYDIADTVGTIPIGGGSIINPGSARAQYMTVQLNGPLTSGIQLVNSTALTNVTYNGTILAGHYVVLDTNNFTAVDDVGANVIANVNHTGAHTWMELVPGNNGLVFVGSGTGNAVVTFKAPYL